jgi:pimeloyl-ACP methyl ester carboxylesterase
VALNLSQPQLLGLSAKDAQELQKLTEERYALMAKDSLFRSVPSALPYCFAETRPAEGLAMVHVPKACTSATSCIVFLHGYGGSFLWNLQVLAEAFPDCLIVCPAYGMSCGSVPREYVREAIKAAETKLGFTVAKPTLVGLSAGGFGACTLYADRPNDWRKMICLAAYARDPALSRVAPGMTLRFIAGADEFYVIDGSFRRGAEVAKKRGASVDSFLVPGCGHFFLLQKPDETIAVLRRWLAE